MPLDVMLLRLATAALLGSIIGYERDIHGRAAGLRTHMLVSIGATLFTLVSMEFSMGVDGLTTHGDPGRIAAQIVTGIGFLGAGTILKSGFTVRGLTTAAYLWLVAAIGVACAIGQIPLAILVAIGTDILVVGIKWAERFLPRKFHLKVIISTNSYTMLQDVENLIRSFDNITITTINRQATRQNTEVPKMIFKSKIEISINTVKKSISIGKNCFWQKYFVTQDAVVKAISEKLHALQPGLLSFAILNGK